jgi:hypothetical protein
MWAGVSKSGRPIFEVQDFLAASLELCGPLDHAADTGEADTRHPFRRAGHR